MVLERDAEDADDAVVEEPVQHPALTFDRCSRHRVELVEVAQRVFGRKAIDQLGKIPNPADQDRRPHLPARIDEFVLAVEELDDDRTRNVPRKRLFDAADFVLFGPPTANQDPGIGSRSARGQEREHEQQGQHIPPFSLWGQTNPA